MPDSSGAITQLLYRSLIQGPLLLDDLPEAAAFPQHLLSPPPAAHLLNLHQKLGHLYEEALAAILTATPQYEVLAKGLQIRQETGRTLGELDFLVRDQTSGQLIHLELAVKFYLAIETADGVLLPGPDARDNYFRKLQKMRSHQLLLAQKFPDLLPAKFRDEKIVTQQLVHGCIFNHISSVSLPEIEFLSPNCRRGKWLHASEVTGYFGKNAHIELIPKHLWPVPLDMLSAQLLEDWPLDPETNRCVMVRVNAGNTPYFIAPNCYPH